MPSLQEILAFNELHVRNKLGPVSGGTPSNLYEKIGAQISEQRKIQREKELLEENNRKVLKQYGELTNSEKLNGKIKISEGKISYEFDSSNNEMKPVYEYDRSIKKPVKVGEIEKSSEFIVPALTPDEFAARQEARMEKQRVFDAQKRFDAYVSDANQVINAIDKLQNQALNLGDFKRGGMNQLGARISTLYGQFSKDEEITRYLGVLSQELIPFARKVMEERGPITEFDVNRVEKGLGDLTTPLDDKLFLLNQLKNKVLESLNIKRQEALNPGSFNPDFENFDKNEQKMTDEEAWQEYLRITGGR